MFHYSYGTCSGGMDSVNFEAFEAGAEWNWVKLGLSRVVAVALVMLVVDCRSFRRMQPAQNSSNFQVHLRPEKP
jgi:hypothetical protein